MDMIVSKLKLGFFVRFPLHREGGRDSGRDNECEGGLELVPLCDVIYIHSHK